MKTQERLNKVKTGAFAVMNIDNGCNTGNTVADNRWGGTHE